MTETVMSAAELCRARDTLGLTDDKLAATLGLPPSVVSAWAAGRGSIPRHIARDVRWRAALAERDQMLAASGLPSCEWVERWESNPVPGKLDARAKALEQLNEHVGACPTCLAREAYVKAHCPPLPEPPLPIWVKGVRLVVAFAERLPKWAQPAVHVGAAFGAYSLFRILFWLPRMAAHPADALVALEGLLLSITIGATVGAIYGGSKQLWVNMKARRIA